MKNDSNVDSRFQDHIKKVVLQAMEEREKSGGGGNSGGGRNDGDGSAWKQSVETRLGQLHSDIRLSFTGVAAVGALIIGLYVWVGYKFDSISDKAHTISSQNAVIETKLQATNTRITSIESKMEGVNDKLDTIVKSNRLK